MADIDMSIDGVREAVRRVRADIATQAASTASTFRNTKLPAGSLSARPVAQAFVEQHNAVHEVYIETIKKVESELLSIAEGLEASANEAQGVDDHVAALLARHNPDAKSHSIENAYLAAVRSDETTLAPGERADAADAANEKAQQRIGEGPSGKDRGASGGFE